MSVYDSFANYYDLAMGDRTGEMAYVEKLVKQYAPTAEKLLDLGCGTGTLLKYFFDRGFHVEGVDLSEGMLAVARQKLPKSKFTQQDMSAFSLSDTFDVITCVFDSINHLTKYVEWENVFSRVNSHLRKDGIFIFDMNTQMKLETLVHSEPFVKKFNDIQTTMTITRQNDVYNWNIRITDQKKEKKFYEEDILEKSFPIRQVRDSLKKIFSEVFVLNQNDTKTFENSQRVYFVCRAAR